MTLTSSLFQARCPSDAELVRKAQSEGIRILPDGSGATSGSKSASGSASSAADGLFVQKLPASMVEETLILAEIFDLNEINALQLLIQGQLQSKLTLLLLNNPRSR